MYLIAFFMIGIGGIFLKKVFVFESKSHFIMELPNYKIPSIKHAMNQMFRQAKSFIIKASTIILVMNTIVWFMQAYSFDLSPAIDQNSSIIAYIGSLFIPIIIPLGFGIWQLAAASITGFIAKENVVATVAVLLATTSEEALFQSGGTLTQFLNPVTAYAFLVFNLFTPPCFAAIGALDSELSSKNWLFRALSFQLLSGYTLALLSYQIGSIVFYGQVGEGFTYAIIYLLFLISLILYLLYKAYNKRKILN
jgi:ferrous iron transport protein B